MTLSSAILLSSLILPVPAFAVQCQTNGSFTYCNDGTSYNRLGDQTIGSNGVTYQHMDNATYGSDGSRSQQFGNTRYNSNGTTCTTYGSATNCSDRD